jgi:hypothetical protein
MSQFTSQLKLSLGLGDNPTRKLDLNLSAASLQELRWAETATFDCTPTNHRLENLPWKLTSPTLIESLLIP